ncbi:MAG: protein translocase subunit SecD [Patescibacteria group bacterium]
MKRNSSLLLVLIILLAVAAGVFVYPKGIGSKWREWHLGLDLVGGSHLIYKVDLSEVKDTERDSVLAGLRDVIERRVNLFGVSEPQVYLARSGNETNLVVELAGVKEISDAIRQIGETPMLDFREVAEAGTSTEFIPTILTGRYISGAQLSFNPTTNAPEVSITFNDEGAKIFEELTGRNVGRPLAIFLDGALIEMPTVQQQISGGQAQITGKFTIQAARQLVERFNAGALPAPVTLINQQTTSPTLGTDSLKTAIIAGIAGTLLVMLFMLIYYGYLGLFAVIALLVYIALTLAIFKIVPITLTLAGLAGFILTIGMAVDANILVFERVKEEMKKGFSRAAAMHEGFRQAWPSIRDSNTSTIITAIILYFFTSSFVKGFALTLFLGVVVSMFSAITTTRLLLDVFAKDKKIHKHNE